MQLILEIQSLGSIVTFSRLDDRSAAKAVMVFRISSQDTIDVYMYIHWRSKKLKKKGGIIFTLFSSALFLGRTNLKLIEKQKKL